MAGGLPQGLVELLPAWHLQDGLWPRGLPQPHFFPSLPRRQACVHHTPGVSFPPPQTEGNRLLFMHGHFVGWGSACEMNFFTVFFNECKL